MAFSSFMHDRNIYKERPDFEKLAMEYPEFRKYIIVNEKGKIRVDFTDTDTLRSFTKILLKKDFGLDVDIPKGFLIPTIPQRMNYILWIEDLLTLRPVLDKSVRGIDIGTGPCSVFSILGAKKFDWHFISTESSEESLKWASLNIQRNSLQSNITLLKVNDSSFLEEVLSSNDVTYDFCLCNPPFFENIEEIRKKHPKAKGTIAAVAKEGEIVSKGGEVEFVKNIIRDSLKYKNRVSFYTSMFGKKKSFIQVLKELENIDGISYTKTEFCQGNTIRWGLAWTFLKDINFEKLYRPVPKKPPKAKPPLIHKIENKSKKCTIKTTLNILKSFLEQIEIQLLEVKCVENFAEIHITSDKNTWSHQRRKRREHMEEKSPNDMFKDTIQLSSSTSELQNSSQNLNYSNEADIITDSRKRKVDAPTEVMMEDIPIKRIKSELDNESASSDLIPAEDTLIENKSDDKSLKKIKSVSESPCEVDLSIKNEETLNFKRKSLLFSILKLRKSKNYTELEINCPPDSNRESMYQVFQYLKNKLSKL